MDSVGDWILSERLLLKRAVLSLSLSLSSIQAAFFIKVSSSFDIFFKIRLLEHLKQSSANWEIIIPFDSFANALGH